MATKISKNQENDKSETNIRHLLQMNIEHNWERAVPLAFHFVLYLMQPLVYSEKTLLKDIKITSYFLHSRKYIPMEVIKHLIVLSTVIFLSFRTDRSGQTVEQSDQGLEEQSDLGLHCLQFPLHLLDALL